MVLESTSSLHLFRNKILEPRVNFEKIALVITITGLAVAILGVVAFQVHFPGSVHFFNLPGVKLGLTVGGTATALSSLIPLVIKTCKEPLPANENGAPPTDSNDTIEDPEYLKKIEDELAQIETFLREDIGLSYRCINDDLYIDHPILGKYSGFFVKYINKDVGEAAETIRKELKKGERENWEKIAKKIRQSATKAYPFLQNHSPIKWATGTRSPCLIGMSQLEEPALVPTGILVDKNIVPLTGELFMGIGWHGINRHHLSGCSFEFYNNALRYAHSNILMPQEKMQNELDIIKAYPDHYSLLRIKIAVFRLLKLGASEETIKEAKEHLERCKNELTPNSTTLWEKYIPLIGEEVKVKGERRDNLPPGTVVSVKGSTGHTTYGIILNEDEAEYYVVCHLTGSTKWISKEAAETFEKDRLDEALRDLGNVKASDPAQVRKFKEILSKREFLEDILSLFEQVKPIDSEQESRYLSNSFPIVWASTSELQFRPVSSGIKGEVAVEGALRLGEEINVAFTKAKKKDELEAWLSSHSLSSSVKVMSFGTALYFQAIHLVDYW
ncbi:MAG: hypothetical protein JJU12_04950 [Chlamydiales bacterium]|nr:hypothetical protein [Chlamydiales bacterium]